jgi:hypothetical protein
VPFPNANCIFNKKVEKKKKRHYICNGNDKFRKLLTLQITTVVDPNVAEYKFLQEVLLLKKKREQFSR